MAGIANASLIGDVVHFEREYQGTVFRSVDFLVGAGIEDTGEASSYRIDVGANTITMLSGPNNFGPFGPSPHTMSFSSLDWFGEPDGFITGVSFVANNLDNVTLADVSFTAHSVTVDISNMFTRMPSSWTVTLETNHDVPEPVTLTLVALGVFGLALRRRNLN